MKDRNVYNKLNNKDSWATPVNLITELECIYGKFDFDPCPLNHDLNLWNGLNCEWGMNNFINPPYDRKLKEAFVLKAIEESKKGKRCVMLLPVSTSTKLFHDYILPNKKHISFLRGRVKFEGINLNGNLVSNRCGMHDSMIVVF